MKHIRIYIVIMLSMSAITVKAQSVSHAKSLIEQGKYREAAQQLRPLADGGNAEAQCLAAQMFFEGKGVAKNDAQGVKYATLAANQGNEEAINQLANHYWSTNSKKAFEILKHYTDRHPYMKKKSVGIMLAKCYLEGVGTEKNEALGWQLAESNEQWDDYLKNERAATNYYKYKMHEAGKDCIEDYADYLFSQRNTKMFKAVCEHIQRQNSDIQIHYQILADKGNGFAAAMLADSYYDRNLRPRARDYLRKALDAGSAYARSIERKVNFEPVIYDHVSSKWYYASSNNKLEILKIEHKWNKTIFHFNFNAKHAESWIKFDKGFYALCNGRKYMMTSPATTKRNPRTNMRTGTDIYFPLEFEAIPTNWSEMSLGINGKQIISNVRR